MVLIDCFLLLFLRYKFDPLFASIAFSWTSLVTQCSYLHCLINHPLANCAFHHLTLHFHLAPNNLVAFCAVAAAAASHASPGFLWSVCDSVLDSFLSLLVTVSGLSRSVQDAAAGSKIRHRRGLLTTSPRNLRIDLFLLVQLMQS